MKINLDTPSEEAQIQILPLMDVIFCILTFFILAALQFTRQQAITINVPQAGTGTALPQPGLGAASQLREMAVVSIDQAGQTYIDKQLVDRVQLFQVLQRYVQQNPNGLLVLNASQDVRYNTVIEILDLLRSVGGDRVALATLPAPANQLPGVFPQGQSPNLSPLPTAPSGSPSQIPGGTSIPGAGVPGSSPGSTVPGQVPQAPGAQNLPGNQALPPGSTLPNNSPPGANPASPAPARP